MPFRIQNYIQALGTAHQTNISTVAGSPGYIRVTKLNSTIAINEFMTEDDAAEIGKGNEFIANVYPTAYSYKDTMEKFGGCEFLLWAWAYALGNITNSTGALTCVPIDPATTLELPYFPVVAQAAEGGSGNAIDELYIGNAMEEVQTVIKYGPGRESVKTTATWQGTGNVTSPSTVSVPATLAEHNLLGSSLLFSLTNNSITTNYVSNKTIVEVTLGWKNNLLVNLGYYPGSGISNGAALIGRLLIGPRTPTFTFRAMMLYGSPEYNQLVAQVPGTATCSLQFETGSLPVNHYAQWVWQKVTPKVVTRGQESGIVTVDVTMAPQYDSTNGILTFTEKSGVTTIG